MHGNKKLAPKTDTAVKRTAPSNGKSKPSEKPASAKVGPPTSNPKPPAEKPKRRKNGDKKEEEEGSAYDEFVPAAAVASQYYMDQIHLEKPTKSEIQDALKKQDDGDEPLRPPGPCPSEYQLEALNQQLKALPMVVAFNEMEKKKATN